MKHTTRCCLSALCLLFSMSLTSCNRGESTETRVLLSKKENIDSTIMIHSVKELQDITRYDSCILYVSLEGCHYCYDTKKILKEYIKANETIIYEVDRSVYASAYDEKTNQEGKYAFLYPRLEGFPGFLFYQSGKLVDSYLNSISTEDDLTYMLKDKVYQTNRYCLNDVEFSVREDSYSFVSTETDEICKSEIALGFTTTELKDKIEKQKTEDKPLNVLYTWRRCSDCKTYQNSVLMPFMKKNEDAKVYYYETDGYMQLKRREDAIGKHVLSLWASFCNEFHLNAFSYDNGEKHLPGFVPSVLSYQKDNYQFSVFMNQQDLRRNEDGTLSYYHTWYDELKNIRSKTKVEQGDTTSSTYQKALKELNASVLKEDIRLNSLFLEDIFHE